MIRKPKDENEKTFLEKFGEKEWLIQKNKEKDYSDILFYPDMSYYVESNKEENDNEKTKSGY